ncbi:MAG TPA: hypothetical protein ENH50_10790 [Nitrospirae bacterium]|nr:hypothetical protein [Nitrospirota bacterium]
MIIIKRKITGVGSLEGLERDTVVLNREDRRRYRQRIRTTKGIEIGIALPTGTLMQDGDVLYLDNDRYIVVEAEKEDMIVIFPENTIRSAMVAYEIGNRHLPISLKGGNIVTPHDRFIEEFLRKESINYERRREAFEPGRRGDHHG